MVVSSVLVGTYPIYIFSSAPKGFHTDFIVENLSNNNVYAGEDYQVSSSTGLKIFQSTYVAKDGWKGGLYLVADGLSDCRVMYQVVRDKGDVE